MAVEELDMTREGFLMLLDAVRHDLDTGVKETLLKYSCEQTYGQAVTARLWERVEQMRGSGIIK